uniref:uncharacterized protein LOC120346072 n=1 Tax=Styela clava TaxID=7725 RepID=UPI00193A8A36|nr:uncharacterized protein LOC120346072 [Styela clava]
MDRIEQKLSATKKPQQVRSRNQQRPTTTTKTTLKRNPSPENCKLKIGNICYFFVISVGEDVIYDIAVDSCEKRNADVGLIRDKESYNAIMKYLGKGEMGKFIWTGIRIDPMTRDVTPADSFIKWYTGSPLTGIEYIYRTNVYLNINYNHRLRGMGNAPPTREMNGVICEIQI